MRGSRQQWVLVSRALPARQHSCEDESGISEPVCQGRQIAGRCGRIAGVDGSPAIPYNGNGARDWQSVAVVICPKGVAWPFNGESLGSR